MWRCVRSSAPGTVVAVACALLLAASSAGARGAGAGVPAFPPGTRVRLEHMYFDDRQRYNETALQKWVAERVTRPRIRVKGGGVQGPAEDVEHALAAGHLAGGHAEENTAEEDAQERAALPRYYEAAPTAPGVVVTPVAAKAKCKGAACPRLAGRPINIALSAWPSVNQRTCFAEETSGWYFFWLDEDFTVPLVPSRADLASAMHGKESGYLKDGQCGSLLL